MQNICVCVIVDKEQTEIFEFGHGKSATSAATASGASADPEIKANAADIDINKGLDSFQIVPKSITCGTSTNMDLFATMIMHRNRNFKASYSGSNHLGLEISHRQLEFLRPTEKDLRIGHSMRDSTGYESMIEIAKRKLTTLGLTQVHCEIFNSEYKIKRMTQEIELSASISEVQKFDKDAAKKNKEAQGEDHRLKSLAEMKIWNLN